jgi:glycosyltransferase involved in cell wall biosynthesis
MRNKRILLIGYKYPPDSGVGAIRIAKFAKYLPNKWDIHILTTPLDARNYSKQTNVSVHEAPLIWPDASKEFDKVRWVPQLIRAIQTLHKKHNFDCIWQTANPYFPLVAVPVVTRMIDTPFIIDLRDSWTLHPYNELSTPFGRLNSKISKVLEPQVISSADAVTVATEGMYQAYANSYPDLIHKFELIENGYDSDDFPTMKTESWDEFTIIYVGKFSNFRDPEPFFTALSKIQSSYDVSFVHVGNPEQKVEDIVEQLDISEYYMCTGYLDREGVAQWIQRSDLGLAVSGGSPQEMTTKVFDYIACKTPILGCGPDGSMADVINRFEEGYMIQNNITEICTVLSDILEMKPQSLGEGPYDDYTREKSANQLAELINKLCSRSVSSCA